MNHATTKTILVMANSIKKDGRCVAGLEITPVDQYNLGNWIRPIDPTQPKTKARFRSSGPLSPDAP